MSSPPFSASDDLGRMRAATSTLPLGSPGVEGASPADRDDDPLGDVPEDVRERIGIYDTDTAGGCG